MLHTPIYDVRGGRAYCGPTAIAAVTGEPISIIRDVIRAQKGTKRNGHAMPVMGITNTMMLKTMATFGWRVVKTDGTALQARRRIIRHRDEDDDVITPVHDPVFRLDDFLEGVQMGRHHGPHIVHVTGHYYAVDDDEICDTYTKIPMEIHRFKRGRMRWVKNWWKFEKLDN